MVKAGYGALEDRNLLLVSHVIPGTQRGYELVVDRETGLATVFEVYFSGYAAQELAAAAERSRSPNSRAAIVTGKRSARSGSATWIGGGTPPTARHTYTNRLEGKGICWKQDGDIEILESTCPSPSLISSN